MVARVHEELSAAHEARSHQFHLEAETRLRVIQAESERRHEEAMVGRIAHSEATHFQVVEPLRGDFAPTGATYADIQARLVDMGAKAVQLFPVGILVFQKCLVAGEAGAFFWFLYGAFGISGIDWRTPDR